MLEILLIRHGQTDWNYERRIMGDQPIGLNLSGQDQIRELSKILQSYSYSAIFSSPLRRTLETAEILNEGRGIPIQTDNDLREIEYGEWVGKTFKEVRSDPHFKEYYKHPDQPVGNIGESLVQVQTRAVGFVEKIRSMMDHKKVIFVTHADWIKCVVMYYLKIPLTQLYQLRIDNGSVSYLTFEGKRERVLTINNVVDLPRLFLPREPL
jgi:broad specificity phosphatase PhoE